MKFPPNPSDLVTSGRYSYEEKDEYGGSKSVPPNLMKFILLGFGRPRPDCRKIGKTPGGNAAARSPRRRAFSETRHRRACARADFSTCGKPYGFCVCRRSVPTMQYRPPPVAGTASMWRLSWKLRGSRGLMRPMVLTSCVAIMLLCSIALYVALHHFSERRNAGSGDESRRIFGATDGHGSLDRSRLPVPGIATIVILTHLDNDAGILAYLRAVDCHYSRVRDVLVVCNGMDMCNYERVALSCLNVRTKAFASNFLTNRFDVVDHIHTPAVYQMDRDQLMHPHDIDSAVDIWMGNRRSIVGAFPVSISVENGYRPYGETVRERFAKEGFNALLTGGALFSSDLLRRFMSPVYESFRTHVNSAMNCEDILFSFVHEDTYPSFAGKRPGLVAMDMRKMVVAGSASPANSVDQLHDKPDHWLQRTKCVRLFSRSLRLPRYSGSFRSRQSSLTQSVGHASFVPVYYGSFPPQLETDPFHDAPSLGSMGVRVLSLMDEFTWLAFRTEWTILQPSRETWKEDFLTFDPHFVFIESAWMPGNSWSRMFFKSKDGNFDLLELVQLSKSRGVPVVFWNKEDPPSFEYFAKSTVLSVVDFIFTTAEELVPEYQRRFPSAKVGVLPFAASSSWNSAFRSSAADMPYAKACFIGTYNYNIKKFPSRHLDVEKMIGPAARLGSLLIFDRADGGKNGKNTSVSLPFPPDYDRFRVDSVPYSRILQAYNACPIHLNVNSVTDSRTMFARRVYEVLMAGKVVISMEHPGIASVFGRDIVFLCNSSDCVFNVLSSPTLKRDFMRRRALGWSAVAGSHTYRHRAYAVAEAVMSSPGGGSQNASPALSALQARKQITCATIGGPCSASRCRCMNDADHILEVDVWFVVQGSTAVSLDDLIAPLLAPRFCASTFALPGEMRFASFQGLPVHGERTFAVASWVLSVAGVSQRPKDLVSSAVVESLMKCRTGRCRVIGSGCTTARIYGSADLSELAPVEAANDSDEWFWSV